MEFLRWLLIAGLSFLFGVLYVYFLTVHPLKMSRYLFGASLALFSMLVALAAGFSGAEFLLAVPLCLALALGGYAAGAHAVLSREDSRPIPDLTRRKDDPGLGHTAVVYFTHGEPETYDPIGWINQFKEFDKQRIRFVPFLIRPYFIYQLRKKYLMVGKTLPTTLGPTPQTWCCAPGASEDRLDMTSVRAPANTHLTGPGDQPTEGHAAPVEPWYALAPAARSGSILLYRAGRIESHPPHCIQRMWRSPPCRSPLLPLLTLHHRRPGPTRPVRSIVVWQRAREDQHSM